MSGENTTREGGGDPNGETESVPPTTGGEGDDDGVTGDAAGEPSGLLRRVVVWLFGLDVSAVLLPRLFDLLGVPLTRALDGVAGGALFLARLTEVDGLESVVVAVSVVGYGGLMWGLSWVFLLAVAMLYVPRLLRPEDTDWPRSYTLRLVSVVPFAGAGLLAEAGLRRSLSALGEPTTAPFVAPLTVETIGGTLLAAVVLFSGIYLLSPGASPRENTLVGYVSRGVVLVAVIGVLLAEFSMLSPLVELFAMAFLLASYNSPLPGDPVERLIEGAAAVWEHLALTAMVVAVCSVLATVGFVLLWVRLRTPAGFLGRAPLRFGYLVVFTTLLSTVAYLYCSETLLTSRRNYDPETERSKVPNVGLWTVALGTSLLLDAYAVGDPLSGPGALPGLAGLGLLALVAAMFLVGSGDMNTQEVGELSVVRSVTAVGERPRVLVEFVVDSGYEFPVDVEIRDQTMKWRDYDVLLYGRREGETRELADDRIRMTTVVPAGGERRLRYELVSPPRLGMRTNQSEYSVSVTPADGRQFADGSDSRSNSSLREFALSRYPRHHAAVLDVAVFFGVLGVVVPSLQGVPDAVGLLPTIGVLGGPFLLPFGAVVAAYLPFGIGVQRRELAVGSADPAGDGLAPTAFGLSLTVLFFATTFGLPERVEPLTTGALLAGAGLIWFGSVVFQPEIPRYAARAVGASLRHLAVQLLSLAFGGLMLVALGAELLDWLGSLGR